MCRLAGLSGVLTRSSRLPCAFRCAVGTLSAMPNSAKLNGGTDGERRTRARVAAYTRWAFEPDRSAATAPARRASDARFLELVDPDGVLSPEERAIRAEAARRAHFLRMAHRSAQVRRARAAGQKRAPDESEGAA